MKGGDESPRCQENHPKYSGHQQRLTSEIIPQGVQTVQEANVKTKAFSEIDQ